MWSAPLDEDRVRDYLNDLLLTKQQEGAPRAVSLVYSRRSTGQVASELCAPRIESGDKNAQQFSDAALTQYLFGRRATSTMSEDGVLHVGGEVGEDHRKLTKLVATGFFNLPDAEHISAVMFTNAGTHAKFTRMGYQMGVGANIVHVVRVGTAYDEEPSAALPSYFSYNLDWPPRVETWGEGLSVVHNPKALHPIPNGFFPSAIDTRLEDDGRIASFHRSWHPIASKTLVGHNPHKVELAELMPPLPPAPIETLALSKDEFHRHVAIPPVASAFLREEAWMADSTGSFLGVVVFDRADDWGFYVYARDQFFRFYAVEGGMGLKSREEAGLAIQKEIVQRLRSPQRIFPRSDEVKSGT